MRSVLLLAAALCLSLPAYSQTYPSKPLRMVVNFPPGGAADQIGRALGAKLQEVLGQPVVVENRPGANGNIGVVEVAKTAPDGHTLLMSSGGAITTNPHLFAKLAVDPMKELEPVAHEQLALGAQLVAILRVSLLDPRAFCEVALFTLAHGGLL